MYQFRRGNVDLLCHKLLDQSIDTPWLRSIIFKHCKVPEEIEKIAGKYSIQDIRAIANHTLTDSLFEDIINKNIDNRWARSITYKYHSNDLPKAITEKVSLASLIQFKCGDKEPLLHELRDQCINTSGLKSMICKQYNLPEEIAQRVTLQSLLKLTFQQEESLAYELMKQYKSSIETPYIRYIAGKIYGMPTDLAQKCSLYAMYEFKRNKDTKPLLLELMKQSIDTPWVRTQLFTLIKISIGSHLTPSMPVPLLKKISHECSIHAIYQFENEHKNSEPLLAELIALSINPRELIHYFSNPTGNLSTSFLDRHNNSEAPFLDASNCTKQAYFRKFPSKEARQLLGLDSRVYSFDELKFLFNIDAVRINQLDFFKAITTLDHFLSENHDKKLNDTNFNPPLMRIMFPGRLRSLFIILLFKYLYLMMESIL